MADGKDITTNEENNLADYNDILEKNFDDIIDEFIKGFNSVQTQRRYQKILVNFLEFLQLENLKDLKYIHFSQLTTNVNNFLDSYKKFDIEDKNKITNVSTINNTAYCLRSFFNYLIFNYNYPKNPLGNYKPYQTKSHSSTSSLDRIELINILKYHKECYNKAVQDKNTNGIKELRNYLIFCFLSMSLRRSEISSLLWENLDENRQFISIEQKGGTYKHIPLPGEVFDYLLTLKTLKKEEGYDSKYIFNPIRNNSNKTINKPISSDYIFNLIKETCKKLQIDKNITPHSFRKSFIELSLDKNENYNSILNATGHKTSSMIYYYDNRDKLKNNSINQLGELF